MFIVFSLSRVQITVTGPTTFLFFVCLRRVDMCSFTLILLPAMKNPGKLIVARYLQAKSLRPNFTRRDFPERSVNEHRKQFTS